MTQTYKMKHNAQGTIYSLLTVESDGRMTMTFHGTDREISHEANVTEDGRIATAGSLFPGLESGRWQAVAAQMRNEKLEMRNENEEMRNEVAESETTTDNTDCTENHAEAEECESQITNEPIPNQQQMNLQTEVTESPITNEPIPSQQQMNLQAEVTESPIADEPIPNQPRPRRQRKPRKPRVALDGRTAEHTSDIDHQPSAISHQPSSTLKAIGMVAAATVALVVIYETGLLIPLGLIGLATGGILK